VIAYLDSSVLLRIVLNQHPQLNEWSALDTGVSSALIAVECSRSLERLWRTGRLPDEDVTPKREEAAAIVRRLEVLPITQTVLDLASMPLPIPLRTLDAIHLATALSYRRSQRDDRPILFATHDQQLAKAAAALHFEVIGIAA
jgi:predicted nucleic acid-binding protein